MVLFRLWFPLNGVVSGHRGPFELFPHCRWHDVVGRVHKGTCRINKLELFTTSFLKKTGTSPCIIIFCCCCLCCFAGKFPAHPGGEGIMTGLLSGEEEVRAESQQSLLHHFTYRLLALDLRVRMMGEPHLSPITGGKSRSDFLLA